MQKSLPVLLYSLLVVIFSLQNYLISANLCRFYTGLFIQSQTNSPPKGENENENPAQVKNVKLGS